MYKFYHKRNFKILAILISRLNIIFSSLDINPQAEISKHAIISHGIGTVIGGGCVIGKNVIIRHNVTLGQKESSKNKYLDSTIHPMIKDNILIGTGSCILGGITIGENSVIGANPVVTKDVPANSCTVGIPAKIIYTINDQY